MIFPSLYFAAGVDRGKTHPSRLHVLIITRGLDHFFRFYCVGGKELVIYSLHAPLKSISAMIFYFQSFAG